MSDPMNITPGAGLTLTREQLDKVEQFLQSHGQARMRNLRREFNEVEFIMGAAVVISALTTGGMDQVPPLWIMNAMSGRSTVDPDGVVKKELGLEECVWCGRPGTHTRDDEGVAVPLCVACAEEFDDERK